MSDWWNTDAYKESKSLADAYYAAKEFTASVHAYDNVIEDLRAKQSDPRAAGSGLGIALQKILANRSIANLGCSNAAGAFADAQEAIKIDPSWQKAWFRLASALLEAGLAQEALQAAAHGLALDTKNTDFVGLLKKCEAACQQAADQPQPNVRKNGRNGPQPKSQLQQQAAELLATAARSGLEAANSPRSPPDGGAALQQQFGSTFVVSPGAGPRLPDQPKSKRSRGTSQAAAELPAMGGHAPAAAAAGSRPPANGSAARTEASPDEGSDVEEESESDSEEADGEESSSSSDSGVDEVDEPIAVEVPRTPEQVAEEHKIRGGELFKAGLYDAARAAYGDALELLEAGPLLPTLYNNRAAACLMLRRYEEALSDSLKAVELDGSSVRGLARAAKACMCMGRMEQAAGLYHQAITLQPADSSILDDNATLKKMETQLKAGQLALERQQWAAAEQHATVACRMCIPAIEPAMRLKCEALLGAGRFLDAVAESRGLTRGGDPYAAEVLALRACASYGAGNIAGATRLYEEVMRRDPDNGEVARGLKKLRSLTRQKQRGNDAFKGGRYQEAYDEYSGALDQDPAMRTRFVVELLSNRAAVCCKLGRHSDAVADAERAIDIEGDYQKAYLRRAAGHMGLQAFEAAVRDYEKAAELGSDGEGSEQVAQLLRDAKVALKKSKRVDYYALLEIDQSASEVDIKKGFRRACLKWHPDKAKAEDREENERMFKLVNEGNGVLSDANKRRKYDAGYSLEEIEQGGGGMGGGHSSHQEEMFASMFAARGGYGRSGGFGGSNPYGFG